MHYFDYEGLNQEEMERDEDSDDDDEDDSVDVDTNDDDDDNSDDNIEVDGVMHSSQSSCSNTQDCAFPEDSRRAWLTATGGMSKGRILGSRIDDTIMLLQRQNKKKNKKNPEVTP